MLAEHGTQRSDRVLGDYLIGTLLEFDGGGAGCERKQHGRARGWKKIEEKEEAATVLGVGDDAAEEVGRVLPEGRVKKEGHLVEHSEAEAAKGLLLLRWQRWREHHATVLRLELQDTEGERYDDCIGA